MAGTYDSINSYNSNSTAYVGYINSLSLYESNDLYENNSYTYDAWLIFWDTENSGYNDSNRTYDGVLLSSGSDSGTGSSSATGDIVITIASQILVSSDLSALAVSIVKALANLDITLNSIATINQFIPGSGVGSGTGTESAEGAEYTPEFNAWNDSYYSITFNATGYKFLGLDATPATGAQVSIFLESDLTATAYEIQYASSAPSGQTEVFASAIEIQKAVVVLDGLISSVIIALEEQRARINIAANSDVTVTTMKDAYAGAILSGDVDLSPTAYEIQYASSSMSIDGSCTPTAIEILYAVPDQLSGESDFAADSIRVRVVSASLSIETSVNVGSYKFARALVDNLIDADLTATAYKDAFAAVSIDIDCTVQTRAIEILYAFVDPMSSESDVAAVGTEILFTGSQVEIESDTSVTAYEILFAKADLAVDGYVLTLAQEILYPQITISGESDLNATAYKIAKAAAQPSGDVDVSPTSYKFAYARQETQITSEVITEALEILYARAVLDGTAFNVIVGKEILLAKISIGIESAILVLNPTRFSDNIVEDTQNIRTLLIIDNKPITEQNRSLSSSIVQPLFENVNWKATRSRYYKSSSGRKTFSLQWTMIPGTREGTVDLKFARDLINSIGNDPDIHTVKLLNMDSSGTTPYTEDEYNVIVRNYSESLRRRDLVGGEYWWDCTLELEEV